MLPTEANSASHKAQAKAIISTKYFQLGHCKTGIGAG